VILRLIARSAGLVYISNAHPGAHAPGFMLTPASRARKNLPEERNGRRRAELDPLLRDLRDLISAAGADAAANTEEKARGLMAKSQRRHSVWDESIESHAGRE
jgi:hypothetical protein